MSEPVALAGFWRRLAATFLDLTVFNGLSGIPLWACLLAVTFISGYIDLPDWLLFTVPLLSYLLALWLFFAGLEASRLRGTPGKVLMGLQLTDIHGDNPSSARASLRLLSRLVIVLTLGLGYLVMLTNCRRVAWHDRLSATRVVRADRSIKLRVLSLMVCVIGAALFFGPVVRMGQIADAETERGKLVGESVVACDEIVDDMLDLSARLEDDLDAGEMVDTTAYASELDEVERRLDELDPPDEVTDSVGVAKHAASTLRNALAALDSESPDLERAKREASDAIVTSYGVGFGLWEVMEDYTAPAWPMRLLMRFLGLYEEPKSAPPPGTSDSIIRRDHGGTAVLVSLACPVNALSNRRFEQSARRCRVNESV